MNELTLSKSGVGTNEVEIVKVDKFYPHDVAGWFDFRDVYTFIADGLPEGGVFVEVGSWLGKSTIFMAKCLEFLDKNTTFYCVDTWAGSVETDLGVGSGEADYFLSKIAELKKEGKTPFNKFMENLVAHKVDKQVFPITQSSAYAAQLFGNGSIDAIFIDASHCYYSVLEDLNAWFPKLRGYSSYFGGHDYYWGEVKLALEKFISETSAAKRPMSISVVGNSWRIVYQ